MKHRGGTIDLDRRLLRRPRDWTWLTDLALCLAGIVGLMWLAWCYVLPLWGPR